MGSSLHIFPAPFIYFYEVPNHEVIKAEILEKMDREITLTDSSNKESNSSVNTSYWNNDCRPWLKNESLLKNIAWDPLSSMLPTGCVPKTPKSYTLRDVWVNKFETGSWHGPHVHPTSDLSGVYIVSMEGENPTSFTSPGDGSNMFFSVKEAKEAKEGTLMLFPSGLLHQVNPSKGPRVSLAYNIVFNF